MRRHLIRKLCDTETPEVNLTPLIDVVFVVLIGFILIAPLLQLEDIELAGGNEQTKPLNALAKSQAQIRIRADNSILFDQQLASSQQLPLLLKRWKAETSCEVPPLVFCDKRASFGTYQAVKLALERAGFEQMELVVTPVERQSR